jgi:hypothetical protein
MPRTSSHPAGVSAPSTAPNPSPARCARCATVPILCS